MEPRSHVFASLPRLERGQIVSQSEPIATITLGNVVGGLELCTQTASSLANIGLFARITSPVPGYILYSTFAKGQLWRPRTASVPFHGVKVIPCPYVLGFLLCGGDSTTVEAANLDLKQAVGPEVRLVSCTHTVQSVPLSWTCARLSRLLPPGTSLRPYLRDLRVHNTFNQTILGPAVITHAPDLIPRRRMLELCEEWEAHYDDWEVPEMELMAINPFFVNVTCEGSTFQAPSISVTVYRDQALRKLRSLAVFTYWPLIRLVYISHMHDEASFFHELPLEVVELICTYVSPEMFGK